MRTNLRTTMNDLLGSIFLFGYLPLRPAELRELRFGRRYSFQYALCSSPPGGVWGVEKGEHRLEWIGSSMHCTRVTVLKLSFNGRECQIMYFLLSRLSFGLSYSDQRCSFF